MKKEEDKYVVVLALRDGRTYDLLEESDFKKCKNFWKKSVEQWQECHTEKKLFVIEKPVLIAFEPGLIYQIECIPKIDPVQNVEDDNPYKQRMQQSGLMDTMQGAGSFRDILDGGRL